MSSSTILTVDFIRPVYAHELYPGDMFAFFGAPRTVLTVVDTDEVPVSADLTLATLTLAGCDRPLALPDTTRLQALRMVRMMLMDCLLCGKREDIELDLPRCGEPLALICGAHGPEPAADAAPAAA
ncbi:hypothetical protein WKI65_44120 [Streptomyces sp. MS1.AVA.3]|uniref:hypothetical protein n=1 Tax=Streptomyces decoyicus TaxID=249567 RepID=UPI0030BDC4C5